MSTYGMSTSIIAPASLNWMPLKDASIGTKMSYKSIKNKPIVPASGGEKMMAGTIRWESIGFTGRVSSTPRYTPKIEYTIENVGDGLGAPPAGVVWTDDDKARGMLLNVAGKIGLRRVGVNCLIQRASVSLNGAPAITTEVARDAELYAQTCNPEDLAVITPASAPDEYCYFDSAVTNNPLKDGGDTPNILQTRGLGGRYEYALEAFPDTHEVVLTVKPSAMIMANPFQFREKTPTPFPSLQKFEMALTLNNLLSMINLHHKRIDPAAAGGAIGDEGIKRHLATAPLTVEVTDVSHSIIMESFEESELLETPGEVLYNCPEVETVGNSDSKLLAPGASHEFVLNETRILRGIPTRLLVVARHRRADSDVFAPTRYAVPGDFELDVNNTPRLFSGMKATQRYEENVKAGYNGSFSTYAGLKASVSRGNPGSGGITCIEFNALPLGSFVVPNVLDNVDVGGRFWFINQLDVPSTIDFTVYQVFDNFMLFKDGDYSVFRPTISKEDVAKAKVVFADDEASRNSVRGGSWYGDMWNTFRRFINSKGARAGIRSFRNVPMVSSFVGDRTMPGRMLKSVGYGGKKKTGGKATKVGGKGSRVGGALHRVGGSRASPEDLDGFLFE
ncbi:hypothetical protein FNF29_06942 [Cafeteria roenbergensis]|uniref:Major capsid protein V20 C-terminal domain-containing protein n=1 Tax=Cafeteria roenbergensis TaxID=33653 RepID=A0A5A8C545_CAFRO|nr:hypothetical protein FNF29_06942 [Cafeteria roenbergensis]|eukprot:KAA0147998.1 hypothetical protein FNF29_06942 [Cafeteria roenbergensis]